MILAVDVFYQDDSAVAAGVVFPDWEQAQEQNQFTVTCYNVQEYISGQFYQRELPCLLKLIKAYQLEPDAIVIDGFVYLDGHSSAGLGKYLYDALHGKVPVIGVAKNPLKTTPSAWAIYRGHSTRPLYVTSAGIELETAKALIKSMHGSHRVPTLLKKVDLLCRQTPD